MSTRKDLIHLGTDFVGVEALLNNVRRKLQLAESDKVFGDQLEDKVVFCDIFELQNILDQVVAIWIFYQWSQLLDDYIRECHFLDWPSLLKTALHHTAPVFVSSDLSAIPHTGLENKLSVDCSFLWTVFVWIRGLVTRIEWCKEGLDNMIAMNVSCKFENVGSKLSDQHRYFEIQIISVGAQNFNKGLNCSSTMDRPWNLNALV